MITSTVFCDLCTAVSRPISIHVLFTTTRTPVCSLLFNFEQALFTDSFIINSCVGLFKKSQSVRLSYVKWKHRNSFIFAFSFPLLLTFRFKVQTKFAISHNLTPPFRIKRSILEIFLEFCFKFTTNTNFWKFEANIDSHSSV